MKRAADGDSNIIGRKSAKLESLEDAAERQSRKKEKRKRNKEEDGPKMNYTKSATVFGRIQDAKDSKMAKKAAPAVSSKSLKL